MREGGRPGEKRKREGGSKAKRRGKDKGLEK